jgi:hypothetical protein
MSDLGSIFGGDDSEESTKPKEDDGLYEAALAWAHMGYNVVPQKAPDKKHPGVKWKELQTRRITEAELAQWRTIFANGVGFITGKISGVIVVETDGPAGEALLAGFEKLHGTLPSTLTIRSGSGRGMHRHFKHPGRKVKTTAHPVIKVDVKGDGGFCVLPPSLHNSGERYAIVHNAKPAELPQGLLEFIEAAAAQARGKDAKPHIKAAGASFVGARHRVRAAEALGSNLHIALPVNRTNVALVQSMLDSLPSEYASEFDHWLRAGFALHTFDDGEIGLALWKRFSKRCPEKANLTNFEERWAGFNRVYEGEKISVGWLWAQAQAHGWRAPCRWDRSTKIAS